MKAPPETFASTAAESDERTAALGLSSRGSEDVSGLLVRPPSPGSEPAGALSTEAHTEWIVDVSLPQGATLTRDAIEATFDQKWREEHLYSTIYGRPLGSREWTMVLAKDTPRAYEDLAIGVPLASASAEEPLTVETLARVLTAVDIEVRNLGATCHPRCSAMRAAERSREIFTLRDRYEHEEAQIVLSANDEPFDGRATWDVMMSLGLRWGDMDLFHWLNEADAGGDDYLFSVHSSVGFCFFPEDIAAGEHHDDYLVFSFSIARSLAPLQIFDNMLTAAQYAQRRLGGTLEDMKEDALDQEAIRRRIREVSEGLDAAGFPAGADQTLRVL